MKNPIAEPERAREDIAGFLSNAIATTSGTMPEDTEYGRAIVDMLKDYGNPMIREMTIDNANMVYRQEFKPNDKQKLMVKKWRESFGNQGRVRFSKSKYYDHEDDTFYEILPRPNYERKQDGNKNYPTRKESINIQKGNVDNLISELAHHVQFRDLVQKEKDYQSQTLYSEGIKYGDSSPKSKGVYGVPGTGEYEAHEEIEPQLMDELERRLDSYLFKDKSAMNVFGNKSAMNVEDLFKF